MINHADKSFQVVMIQGVSINDPGKRPLAQITCDSLYLRKTFKNGQRIGQHLLGLSEVFHFFQLASLLLHLPCLRKLLAVPVSFAYVRAHLCVARNRIDLLRSFRISSHTRFRLVDLENKPQPPIDHQV
jgi:hypothetical protein